MAIFSRYKLKTGEEVEYFPPIQNTANPYLTEAAMHADQANQLQGYGYLVADVGAFTYLGTLAGTAADYKGFGANLRLSNLAADLTTTEQDGIKTKLSITSSSIPNEHQINGIRVTSNVTGTYAIDWNAASVFVLTMTANTNFSFSNLPTGVNSKIITVILTGTFVPTFPAIATLKPATDVYDGAKLNEYTINCVNGTAASEMIYYHNELLN